MAVVRCEGGYRNVEAGYMRKTQPSSLEVEAGLPAENWTFFDEAGRKCICAYERGRLFYWADSNGIQIITVQ